MRTIGILFAAVVASLVTSVEARAQQQGETGIGISAPTYNGPPPTMATLQVTMSLDPTEKNFAGLSSFAYYKFGLIQRNVLVTTVKLVPPVPNGPPTVSTISIPVTKGTTYYLVSTMSYIDANRRTVN